ncbi:uncharacterized protein LOC143038747 [Oratosquilla oratoria]|uniref:uncharacterized protein LOC143038747 n=1 Tax=Oratosquilla oratoria TaxID=337810 RepID=UPI003F76E889
MARFLVVALATALVGLLSILSPGSVQGEVIGNTTLDRNCTSPSNHTLKPGESFKFNTNGSYEVKCVLRFNTENCTSVNFKCNKLQPEKKEYLTLFVDNTKMNTKMGNITEGEVYSFNVTKLRIKYVNKVDEPRDNTTMKCIVRCPEP